MVALPPPKITVSWREWRREIGAIGAAVRWRRYWQRMWGRYAALWRWRRRREDYERLVYAIRRRWYYIRRERELRRILARKIIRGYWRVSMAYQFQKITHVPPYHFVAEFRKYVFTMTPEKYAVLDPITGEWSPLPWFERHAQQELRVIMFCTSLLARVTKELRVKHVDWLEAIYKIRKLPFPNFECIAVDTDEVVDRKTGASVPLDTQQYYVRFEEGVPEPPKGHYGTAEVESWFRHYRRWLARAYARGIIRRPRIFDRVLRQTSIEEWILRVKLARERRRRGAAES